MREPSDHATAPQRRDAAQLTARHALLSSVLRHRLRLEGLLSVTSLAAVRAGLPIAWPDTARVLFATFADADVPLGARFDRVLREGHADDFERDPGDPDRGDPAMGQAVRGRASRLEVDLPRRLPGWSPRDDRAPADGRRVARGAELAGAVLDRRGSERR